MQLHGQLTKLIKSMTSSLEQLANLVDKTALQQQIYSGGFTKINKINKNAVYKKKTTSVTFGKSVHDPIKPSANLVNCEVL